MDKFKLVLQEVKDLRISDERKAEEQKFDKWFYSLTRNQKADFAENFWDNMDFEDKKEEYYIE